MKVNRLFLWIALMATALLACDAVNSLATYLGVGLMRTCILQPSDGAKFEVGDTISLQGDIDGTHADECSWQSSRDGVLRKFSLTRALSFPEAGEFNEPITNITVSDLSIGVHKITFDCSNEEGSFDKTSIKIEILPAGVQLLEEDDAGSEPFTGDQFALEVGTDLPETIESIWGSEIGAMVEGEAPTLTGDLAWANPEDGRTRWPQVYTFDSVHIDLTITPDPNNPLIEAELEGQLVLKETSGLGESGSGTVYASGPLQDLTIENYDEGNPMAMTIEGVLPLALSTRGEHAVFEVWRWTDDGKQEDYVMLRQGGLEIAVPVWVKLDTATHTLQLIFDEPELDWPTGVVDGEILKSLRFNLNITWTEDGWHLLEDLGG
jgi:hypothetical protein